MPKIYITIILLIFNLSALIVNAEDIVEVFNERYKSLKEYRENHEYAQGIQDGLKYLEEMKRLEHGKKKHYALLSSALSYLYDESGEHDSAIELVLEAANIHKDLEGSYSDFYIAALTRLSNFYSHANKYQDAIKVTEGIRSILKEKGLQNTRDYSIVTGNLATYYNNIDEVSKSISAHKEALRIIEVTQDKRTKDYANRLGMLATVQFKAGIVDTAITNLKEAIEILKIEVGCEHLGYMTFVNNLSQMQNIVGDYFESLRNMTEAKDICENLFGCDSPQYASYLSNYANCELKLGKYREGINALSQALDIQKKIYNNNHLDVAITLGSLSSCYTEIGEYLESLKLRQQSMEIFEKISGKKSLYYASSLRNLATNYYYLGNFSKARDNILQACEIVSNLLGRESLEYARILMNQSALEKNMGNIQRSIELDDTISNIFGKTIGYSNNEYASFLLNKAGNLELAGYLEQAIALTEDVLKLRTELFGKLHPSYASTLCELGRMNVVNNDIQTGLSNTMEALSLLASIYGKNNPDYINTLMDLCRMQACSHNFISASSNAIRCNALITAMIRRMFMDLTSHERSLLWLQYRDWFTNFIPQISFYNQRKPVLQMAFDALLFSKSLLLNTDIELLHIISEVGNEEDVKLYHSISNAKRQLTKIYEYPLEQQKIKTDSLENYIMKSEENLLSKCKAYRNYKTRLSVSWKDVANSLGDNDIAIEFASFHKDDFSSENDSLHCVAFVLKKSYESPLLVPIYSLPYKSKLVKDNQIYNNDLTKLIWGPFKSLLQGVEKVYFSPSGELYNIPIEYLPYWDNSNRTVADVYSMHRLSSTREIALNNEKNNIVSASLFGGLIYGTSIDSSTRDIDAPTMFEDTPTSSLLRDGFKPLENTKEEIVDISHYLDKMSVNYHIYSDSVGTESNFRKLSKKNINLLHIATHGFYWTKSDVRKLNLSGFLNPNRFANISYEDQALARSGLLFTGANNNFYKLSDNFNPDDGIVTAKEISQLDFRNMDLAVLSACQTGLGDIDPDGVFGLQRGFKKAGVQSLLMSLWKVDDKATKLLMSNFYKGLSEGLSPVGALRDAQNFLREYEEITEFAEDGTSLTASQSRKSQRQYEKQNVAASKRIKIKPFADPKYWAAFVLLDALD